MSFTPLPIGSLPWPGPWPHPLPLPKLPPVDANTIKQQISSVVSPLMQIPAAFNPPPAGIEPPSTPVPQQQPVPSLGDTHKSFVLFLAEIIGVVVLSFVADTSQDVGRVVVAGMVVLALIWLMYRGSAVVGWSKAAGLGA